MALSKRQERRLKNLMGSLSHNTKSNLDTYPTHKQWKVEREQYYEVFYLAELKGWTEDQLKIEWWKARRAQLYKHHSYHQKPIQQRRDNKDVRVGSGGSNRSSVRFPREARKTAWKRFWKLFPGLDGCRNWDDYHKKCNANPDMVYPLYQAPYKKQTV